MDTGLVMPANESPTAVRLFASPPATHADGSNSHTFSTHPPVHVGVPWRGRAPQSHAYPCAPSQGDAPDVDCPTGHQCEDLFPATPTPQVEREMDSVLDEEGSQALIPKTPIKQRRTIHGSGDGTRLTTIGPKGRRPTLAHTFLSGVSVRGKKCMRKEGSSKRSADVISQFSAMGLDENTGPFTPLPLSGNGTAGRNALSVPRFSLSVPLAASGGGPAQSASSLICGGVPPATTLNLENPRLCGSFSQMMMARTSQDALELSQADTEYSNFFSRRILTDYREVRELGSGSFGKVYLYEESSSRELVAVKISPPLPAPHNLSRYRRERAIMGLVRGFPHVVQLSAAWEEGRVPQMYLQLEYCQGGSVAQVAETKRKAGESWSEDQLVVFLTHMAIALDALHRANIAHVDFKPDNVLIDKYGSYKLSDFGCSVVLDDAGRPRRDVSYPTQSPPSSLPANKGNPVGLMVSAIADLPTSQRPSVGCSPGKGLGENGTTMALECTQMSMASVDEGDCRYLCFDMLNQKRFFKAGDMFSLGMSMYELMSGRALPRNGDSFIALRQQTPLLAPLADTYSSGLIELVAALMREEPTSRPTAREVLQFVVSSSRLTRELEDKEFLARCTGSVMDLQEAIGAGNVSITRIHALSAVTEATAWLLETVRCDYIRSVDEEGHSSIRRWSAQSTTQRAQQPGCEILCTPPVTSSLPWSLPA